MQTLALRNEIGKRQTDKKTKILRKREYSGNSLERSLEHNNLEGPELLDWTSLIGNRETLFIFKL